MQPYNGLVHYFMELNFPFCLCADRINNCPRSTRKYIYESDYDIHSCKAFYSMQCWANAFSNNDGNIFCITEDEYCFFEGLNIILRMNYNQNTVILYL